MLDETIYCCSCDANWDERGLKNSKCWHIESLKRNGAYMERMGSILECAFTDSYGTYFGEALHFREVDRNGAVIIERVRSTGGQTFYSDFGDEGLVVL